MTTLAYLLLGIIAESSISPVNETGNTGAYSALWTLADRPAESWSWDEMQSALSELLNAGLIECAGPAQYRLAHVPELACAA